MNKTLDCESKYKHMKLQHIEQPKKSATSSINNNVLYNNIINKWMPQIIMLGTFLGVILSCYCFENSENNFHNIHSETMLKFNEIIPKNDNSYENDNLNYFINTSKCRIPYVNPLSSEVLKFYKPENTTGCSKEKRLINLLYNNITNRYILHIDMKAIPGYGSNTTLGDDVLRCCYQEIIRSGRGSEADNEFTLRPCEYFSQDHSVLRSIDSLLITCTLTLTNRTLEAQKDAFFLVQDRKSPNQRQYTQTNKKPSLYLWIIDSLSRINFRRTMPKTFNYLKTKKWFELRGYNKVGRNTFPNVMPMLTGYNESTAIEICKPQEIGGYDNCTFIWKEFHKQNYKTAYAEDNANIATFNYLSPGFTKPPTDYYFRPMSLAIEKTLNQTSRHGLTYCVGNRQYGEYIYDMGLQFAQRFQYEPHFGIFWTNSFSHNDYALPATMDSKTLEYLQKMEDIGYFENSIVFFLSDHGKLFYPLDKLPEAFLEDRLPTFFISLPKWFQLAYPELIKNLKTNCKRLTTPYDIYMTMQHLLKMNEANFIIKPPSGCSRCQSLFDEIPEDRTCFQAGIPTDWCACNTF